MAGGGLQLAEDYVVITSSHAEPTRWAFDLDREGLFKSFCSCGDDEKRIYVVICIETCLSA